MPVYSEPAKADAEEKVMKLWRVWLAERGISRPTPTDKFIFFASIPPYVLTPLGKGDPWQHVDAILRRADY